MGVKVVGKRAKKGGVKEGVKEGVKGGVKEGVKEGVNYKLEESRLQIAGLSCGQRSPL